MPVVAFIPSPDRQLARTAMMAGVYDHWVETGSLE